MTKLQDNNIQNIIDQEYNRQQNECEMIASENYVSKDVMNAYGNVFTNKYSEGYPGKRYYGGQQIVDKLERVAQYRALAMFGLVDFDEATDTDYNNLQSVLDKSIWGANVQPLSGSPANLAVYMGILKPNDTILGMNLDAGGHLSHGHPLNSSGVYYNIEFYGVEENSYVLNYDEIETKALEVKPKLILAGFSAYPRNIDWNRFKQIQDKVFEVHGYRPFLMADIAHIAGLIAGKSIEGPFGCFDIITTTTHKTLRGPRGAIILFNKGVKKDVTLKSGKVVNKFMLNRNDKDFDLQACINRGVFPGVQGGPHEHIVAAKAVAFKEVIDGEFGKYTDKVIANAKLLAEEFVNFGWHVLTDGTDNHLILLDVTKKMEGNEYAETDVTGKIAEKVLEDIGISVNKNSIPFDSRPPLDPSGLRLGTPAITTRGLGADEMKLIARIINDGLLNHNDEAKLESLKNEILDICKKFPLEY